jgi:hypothetical protein
LDTSAGCADNAATTVVALCIPKPDPLVLELCVCSGTRRVNPMLDELAASLVMSLPEAPTPRVLSASAMVSQDAYASRPVDTRYLAKATGGRRSHLQCRQ